MPAALDNKQKAYLAQLARQVFDKLCADARREGRVHPAGHALAGWPLENRLWDAGEFRHSEVAKACHKNGLRCCSQDDYGAVKGHFLALLGREGAAVKAMVRGEGNPRRVAEYKLVEALRKGGFRNGYAEAICRNQFHCAVADASTPQLWKLVFTITNRANKRKAAAK